MITGCLETSKEGFQFSPTPSKKVLNSLNIQNPKRMVYMKPKKIDLQQKLGISMDSAQNSTKYKQV